jgi:hypothetical protein
MSDPQFLDSHTSIFNKKISLRELRRNDLRSVVGLYISELILFLGFVLILLNNLNVLAPGSYFGAYNYVTVTVFSFGLIINFISIPFLYFSSFKDFKRESDFWDKEIFWILPLFFFGTFYLYGSEMTFSLIMMGISLLVIALVHVRFMYNSRRFILTSTEGELRDHEKYFESLQYLTFYYLLLFLALVWYNPIQNILLWVRYNL